MALNAAGWPLYSAAVLRPLLEQATVRGVTAAWCPGAAAADTLRGVQVAAAAPALLLWDRDQPPEHERRLIESFEFAAVDARWFRSLLCDTTALGGNTSLQVLRDVARFDGIGHAWHALVLERAADAGIAGVTAGMDVARRRLESALQPYTAADGTMRIPVRALLASLRV